AVEPCLLSIGIARLRLDVEGPARLTRHDVEGFDRLALDGLPRPFRDKKIFVDNRRRIGLDVRKGTVLAKCCDELAGLRVNRRHSRYSQGGWWNSSGAPSRARRASMQFGE